MHVKSTKILQDTLESGSFLLSCELTPPRHWDLTPMLRHIDTVIDFVDVVQLNDQLLAQTRCNTLLAADRVRDAGIEPVLQFSLRHKNRIAVQSDLLGIAAAGLRNALILGGYPVKIGTDPDAKDATDIGGIDAIAAASGMTKGKFFNGDELENPPDLYIGTIEIPCMTDDAIPASIEKLKAKIDAGAKYIQVQAIFDLLPMKRWMEAVVDAGLDKKAHFMAAVFPFSGAERLKFLQQVPGLCVPEDLVQRVSGENGNEESLKITLELVQGIREIKGISGLHVRSIGSEDWIPKIFTEAGLSPSSKKAGAAI